MENNTYSWPVMVFLFGSGILVMETINHIYDALVTGENLLTAFMLLISGCILMPIGFYYTIKSYKKKKLK